MVYYDEIIIDLHAFAQFWLFTWYSQWSWEYHVDLHRIFIDLKHAYDSFDG